MYGTFTVAPTVVQTNDLGEQSVFLNSDESCNLTYVWNTSGASSKGRYNLTACAWPILGEANLANNNFTYSNITVTIPGDITGDGHVSIDDVNPIAWWWGKTVPPAPANADISEDGKIDIDDVNPVAYNWGMKVDL
jgi:hypothetical protein